MIKAHFSVVTHEKSLDESETILIAEEPDVIKKLDEPVDETIEPSKP